MLHADAQTILIVLASGLLTAAGLLVLLLRLPEPGRAARGGRGDRSAACATDDLAVFRALADHAPQPIWIEGEAGAPRYANAAYRALAAGLGTGGPVFAEPDPAGNDARRHKLHLPGEHRPRWYALTASRLPDGTAIRYANDISAQIGTDEALGTFMQTLTKTFAHLSIGLAVFDRDRRLALFNPALCDITGLAPDWLSRRPTLQAMLDRLRETHRLPEPRDYRDWRQKLTALERAARDGTYEETWTLPGGQTLRVVGRPHPEGALAFLIEDISQEVALRRRFRAELELSQSVLDSLDEAIAVFSAAGSLMVANSAYARLWDEDDAARLAGIGILEAIRRWQACTQPSPLWPRLRDFAGRTRDRGPWSGSVTTRDGAALHCRFVPLVRGGLLCGFAVAEAATIDTPAHASDRSQNPLGNERALPG